MAHEIPPRQSFVFVAAREQRIHVCVYVSTYGNDIHTITVTASIIVIRSDFYFFAHSYNCAFFRHSFTVLIEYQA